MSQKRQQEDAKPPPECSSSDNRHRKRPSFRNVVLEVMKLRSFHNYMEPVLEPLIRKVVREEVELALKKHLTTMKWNSGKEMHSSESRSFRLQFFSILSLPVFTGTRIEGEDCNTLKVALIDAQTEKTVSSGLVSSAKVEIVVLEGDFDGDEGDNWTLEEFNNNIVRERQGKKPLLSGDVFLYLKEGIGFVGDISFTDNSSWTRSRKFRLGARIGDTFGGIRIREAKSESFVVRDHRGELYKKHHPPYLSDEVWRLKKIGKEGAFHKRLTREKVKTVKDFLILLFLDPTRLRNILGSGMSAKMWEITVEHARKCVVDDKKLYLYNSRSQQMNGVVFNVVGQVMGLLSDCKYVPTEKLSEAEKADAQKLVKSAFQHLEEVVPYDDEASLISSCLTDALFPSNSLLTGSSDGSKILISHMNNSFDYPQLNASSPDVIPSICSVGGVSSLDDSYGLHGIDQAMDVRFDQPFSFQGAVSNSLICETDVLTQGIREDDEHLKYFDTCTPILESQADLHSAVSSFLFPCTSSAIDKAQRRWKILSSVLKWLSLMLEIRERCRQVFKPQIKL